MTPIDISTLTERRDVELGHPASNLAEDAKLHSGVRLPEAHIDLLIRANGLSIQSGYYRLFGLHTDPERDLEVWNETSLWKYAWQGRVEDFLCFGTTAWGDQYAYHLPSLAEKGHSAVFLLDAYSMDADPLADSFPEFWQIEFLPNATAPYDHMVEKCRQAIGSLDWNELLIYSPHLLLGGTEDVANIVRMSPRVVMRMNAEIALQLERLPDETEIIGVTTQMNEKDEPEIQLITR
jgi:hypothetical protein